MIDNEIFPPPLLVNTERTCFEEQASTLLVDTPPWGPL